MKALILSDIHSNIVALETIWAKENDAERIYCTGDLVDYGPFPRETLAWIRAHHVICTQGNHDRSLVHHYRSGLTLDAVPPEQRAWVHLNAGLVDEADVAFLDSLPLARSFEMDGDHYGMSHLYQEYKEIVSLYAFEQFRAQTFGENGRGAAITRLIFGHTHRQSVRSLSDELLWLNPGSVSYRRTDDPDQSAHYATLTDGVISLRRLPYDLRRLHRFVQGVSLKPEELRAANFFFGPRPPAEGS